MDIPEHGHRTDGRVVRQEKTRPNHVYWIRLETQPSGKRPPAHTAANDLAADNLMLLLLDHFNEDSSIKCLDVLHEPANELDPG